jgi:hypothetical protein
MTNTKISNLSCLERRKIAFVFKVTRAFYFGGDDGACLLGVHKCDTFWAYCFAHGDF